MKRFFFPVMVFGLIFGALYAASMAVASAAGISTPKSFWLDIAVGVVSAAVMNPVYTRIRKANGL